MGRVDGHTHGQAEAEIAAPRPPVLSAEQVEQASSVAVPALRLPEIAGPAFANQPEAGAKSTQEDGGTRAGFCPMTCSWTASVAWDIPSHESGPTRSPIQRRTDILPVQTCSVSLRFGTSEKCTLRRKITSELGFDWNCALPCAQFLVACSDYDVPKYAIGNFLAVRLKERAPNFFMELRPTDPERTDWLRLHSSFEGRYTCSTRQ